MHRPRGNRNAAVDNVTEILLANTSDAALVRLVSLRNEYAGEWHRYVSGEALAIELTRDRFPYIAQGRAIDVRGMDLLSVSDTQPNPTDLSPQQVARLDALPSFEPTQQEAIQLAFVDDEDLLPRSDAVNAFLLMSYTIQ